MRHMRSGFLATALLLALNTSAPTFAQEPSASERCMALANEGKLSEAEPVCAKAAEESVEGKILYGDFLSYQGDFQGAVARYTEVLLGRDKTRPTATELAALRRRAVANFRLKNAAGASEDAAAFLEHQPDDLEILQLGGMTTPFPDVRISYSDRLVKLQPSNVEFHVFRARALSEAGKNREALDAVELALRLDPKSKTALSTRGFIHAAMGDHSKAVKDQARAARLAPDDTQSKTNQAQALVEAKRYAEAIDVATEALKLRPDNGDAIAIRAYARLSMGDGEGALADLESVTRVEPDTDWSEARLRARHLTEMQALMRPESIAQLEADRGVILGVIESHLHGKCGHYSVRSYEDNEGLSAYRKCILEWYKLEDQAFIDAIPPHVVAAGERFERTLSALEEADALKCSVMPKKSRCVDDALFVRLDAAAAGMADPKDVVGGAEYERLNREVHAYNASVKRQNALIKTANFFDALANELSKQ